MAWQILFFLPLLACLALPDDVGPSDRGSFIKARPPALRAPPFLPGKLATITADVRGSQSQPPNETCFYIPLQDSDKMVYRYRNNIHHQSEFLFPALESIMRLARHNNTVVHTVLVEMKLLPWSRAFLRLAGPDVDIVKLNTTANVSELNPAFATFDQYAPVCGADPWQLPSVQRVASGCSKYFQHTETYRWIRERAAETCGLDIPRRCRRRSAAVRIGLLNRHRTRVINGVSGLVSALSAHFRQAELVVRYTYDNATLCQQVAWFAGLDVIIVAHGQLETNAIFLPAGALMIEAVPWSLPNYCTYRATLWGSGVTVKQVVSIRQPDELYLGLNGGNYTQEQCNRRKKCRVWHRDQYNLTIKPSQIIEQITAGGGLRRVCNFNDTDASTRQRPRLASQSRHKQSESRRSKEGHGESLSTTNNGSTVQAGQQQLVGLQAGRQQAGQQAGQQATPSHDVGGGGPGHGGTIGTAGNGGLTGGDGRWQDRINGTGGTGRTGGLADALPGRHLRRRGRLRQGAGRR